MNNGPRPVAEETRKKVLWAIGQLDYQPSAIARSLTTKRTNTVGFIIPDILNPVHAATAKTFEDALRVAEYNLILGNSDEDPEVELSYLRVLLSKGVDGIALTPTGENRRFLFSLVESGKHLLLLDRQLEGLKTDCVLFDNVVGSYQAVRHLIELGHKRIGLINLSSSLTPGRERFQGYERALLEAGINIASGLIREGDFKAQHGETLFDTLFRIEPRPTALFVSSNRLMRGVLRMIKERNIKVPEDLALAAFDDVGYYTDRTPSITAVSTSAAEFGSEAARLLIERVTGAYRGAPRLLRVPCQLKVRESTVGVS
jgi:DNA-binding LacI/PurR family transcriptional regulator